MVQLRVLIFAGCILIAQAAPYEDEELYRVIRSPHYGHQFHFGQYGPFPPFFHHTQSWNGNDGRGGDDIPRGAFSGVAASVQAQVPVPNTAFSLAASEADDCDDDSSEFIGSGNYNSKHLQSNSQSFGSTSGSAVHAGFGSGEGQSTGYGHGSFRNSAESIKYNGNIRDGFKTSQTGQSQGFGQQSNLGNGGKTSDFTSSYHAANPGQYGGSYTKSVSEFHDSVTKGDNGFENTQGGAHLGQDTFGGSGKSYSSESSKSHLTSNNGGVSISSQGTVGSGSNAYGSSSFGLGHGYSKDNSFDSSKYKPSDNKPFNSQEPLSIEDLSKNNQSDSNAYTSSQSQISSSSKSTGLTGASIQGSTENGHYGSGHVDGYAKSHSVGGSNYQNREIESLNSQQPHPNVGFGNKQFTSSFQTQVTSSGNNGDVTLGTTQGLPKSGSSGYGSGHGYGYSNGFSNFNHQYGGRDTQHSQPSGNWQYNSNANTQSSSFGNKGSLGLADGVIKGSVESGKSTIGAELSGQKQDYSREGQNGYLSYGAIGQGQQNSDLKGTLDLASQGLQAFEKTECSTCKQGSYALSNANSYSGAAIALAIGG